MQAKARILALFGAIPLFGQERANIEALAALQEENCQVLCLVRPQSYAEPVRAALDQRAIPWRTSPYLNVWNSRAVGRSLIANAATFVAANWRCLRVMNTFRPTHVYAFNNFYVLNFFAALALTPTPMIFRAGDEPPRHNAFWRWVWRFIVKRTARFVAVSAFIKGRLEDAGVDGRRISVIYGKPPRRSSAAPPFALPPTIASKDYFRILYVGQLTPNKGVGVLVEAFASIAPLYPHARLAIAGRISDDWEGDAWARSLRDSVCADPRLRERVAFLGLVENTPALYRACQLHVCPTLSEEPLANVVPEAKQAGLASVVFASGGLPELVADGVDGAVIEDRSPEALARSLAFYIEHPELAALHGEAARASLEKFKISAFAEQWLDVVRLAQGANP